MSDDVFKNQAVKNGERVLDLLDKDDQEIIRLWNHANNLVYHEGHKPRISYEVREFLQYAGIVSGILLGIICVIFLSSRPDGWPYACGLKHRDELSWVATCQKNDDEKDRVTLYRRDGLCGEGYTKVLEANLFDGWSCQTYDVKSPLLTCKQNVSLPK